MRMNGVEMIPSGLVNCLVNGREVQIIELSEQAFCIRTVERIKEQSTVRVNVFDFFHSTYTEIPITEYKIIEVEQEEFYLVTTIQVTLPKYQEQVRLAIKNYTDYIRMKLYDDVEFQEELTGYPVKQDEEIATDFANQKELWFQTKKVLDDSTRCVWQTLQQKVELALAIDQPILYQQFLSMEIQEFYQQRLAKNHLEGHALATYPVGRVYLGNQFCHNLAPSMDELEAMLEKSYKEGLEVTVATTYLREDAMEQTVHLLERLYAWGKKRGKRIEIIINDWGMADLVRDRIQVFMPVLGILLNKRRKDPRYAYKLGYSLFVEQLASNSVNSSDYREYLATRYGICRYEFETCKYPIHIPSGNHSLHFPYYQTNTSQYCTLYAKCKYDDRGKQEYVKNCPRYCETAICCYPTHLQMVGRYNSIFGLDDGFLTKPEQFIHYSDQGIDRIVCTLL